MKWQVVCIQTHRRTVVDVRDNKEDAEAKAERLNRLSPDLVYYNVEEVKERWQTP